MPLTRKHVTEFVARLKHRLPDREAKLVSKLPASHRSHAKLKSFQFVPRKVLASLYRDRGGATKERLTGFYDAKEGAIYMNEVIEPDYIEDFYHEYGHAVDHDLVLSNKREWRDITASEWGASKKEIAPATTSTGFKVLPPDESWARAYGAYAAGRAARPWLREEKPESYKYMAHFFREA